MDQTTPLPLAKLTAPRVGEVLSRTRLFEQLDSMATFPVTWISGPAGAGKTTLALSYLDSKKINPFWYQIDEGDHDLASFFYHLGLLAQQINPESDPLPLLTPEYLQGLSTFTRNFFRQFFSLFPKDSVFVIDNYQDAGEDNPIDTILAIALQEIPSSLHILVLSRTVHPDSVTRLVTSGHVQTLNWQALQFSEKEVDQLVKSKTNNINLQDNDILLLHSQTQGWAAGLTLCLAKPITKDTLKSFNHSQSQADIFKYFATELFEQADENVKLFLLKTAYLPSIGMDVANKITGSNEASNILLSLAKNNHFTYQKAGSNLVFEYHPLFRIFLQEQVHTKLSSEDQKHIIDNSIKILLEYDFTKAAAIIAISYKKWDVLIDIILSDAESLISQGRFNLLRTWIGSLPDNIYNKQPWVIYWNAQTLIYSDIKQARITFSLAYSVFSYQKDRDITGVVLSWCGCIYTFALVWDTFDELDEYINDISNIESLLINYDNPPISDTFHAHVFLAYMFRQPEHPDFERYIDIVWDLIVNKNNLNVINTIGSQFLIFLSFWLGDIERSNVILNILESLIIKNKQNPLTKLTLKTMSASYYTTRGQHIKCIETVKSALNDAEEHGIYLWNYLLCINGAMGSLAIGDLPEGTYFIKLMSKFMSGVFKTENAIYNMFKSVKFLHDNNLESSLKYSTISHDISKGIGSPYHFHAIQQQHGHILLLNNETETGKSLLNETYEYGNKSNIRTLNFLVDFAYADFYRATNNQNKVLERLQDSFNQIQAYYLCLIPHNHLNKIVNIILSDINIKDYAISIIKQSILSPPNDVATNTEWPYPIKIYAFGRFQLLIGGKEVQFNGKSQKKPLELLKALIAYGGTEVRDTLLAEILWPDAEGDSALDSLKTNIGRLRKLLKIKEAILLTEGKISINPKYCWIDIWAFEHLLDTAQDSKDHFVTAVEYYQGNFFSNEPDSHWLISPRERLRRKFIHAITCMSMLYEQSDDWAAAVEVYNKGLNIDHLTEEFYQGLMRCYQNLKQPSNAVKTYQQCCTALKNKLGISPSKQTEDLFRDVENWQ